MHNVARVVQDKVSSSGAGGGRTMFTVPDPTQALNCLSVNRDCSQVVVAGRNVFKIYSIEDEEFVEKVNLRVGKNLNLNFSASDVAWNPVEDHLLASAATNGAVVTWDLNRSSRSKQDSIFTDHKRTVNRVCFHSNESHLLLSGAMDGFMKLFDLRKKEASSTFSGKLGSVRDVQFSPHQYFSFAAVYDSGQLDLWDMRNPSRHERYYTVHSEPVFTLDWHPDERNWIATGGRDKMIKVWDLTNQKRIENTHSIQTIASVARIKWRPQRKYHISSCALLVDFSINVWDIRRPYIPFAAFNEHKDVATGIVWKHGDPHMFYSSSKDGSVCQHVFKDATRPADSANPVGVDINVLGDVSYASSDRLAGGMGARVNYSSTRLPSFFRKAPDKSEQFTMVSSSLNVFDNEEQSLSMKGFVQSAKQYKLSGGPIQDLCQHNAAIATALQRAQVAQTWYILRLLYTASATTPTQTSKTVAGLANKVDNHVHKDSEVDRVARKISMDGSHLQDNRNLDADKEKHGDTSTGKRSEGSDQLPLSGSRRAKLGVNFSSLSTVPSSGLSDEDSEDNEVDIEQGVNYNLTNIASGSGLVTTNHSDFFFGDGDIDQLVFDDPVTSLPNGQDWTLPNEAFQPRHEIKESMNDALAHPNPTESLSSPNESEATNTVLHLREKEEESNIKQEILSCVPFWGNIPTWQCTELVCEMLKHYADQGDVQMSVTVLIVLGEKIRPHVDETTQEHWFMSYIDLLGRFKLWSIATEIINLSSLPAIMLLNHQSTTIHTSCSKCGKALVRTGWLCDRCKGAVNTCCICHHPVKGLYVWCQGCAHGGHLHHIQDWLLRNKHCPTGCGHLCEYT